MLCKIADLLVDVPAGGMEQYLEEYLVHSDCRPDIVIRKEKYHIQTWPNLPEEMLPYMASGEAFYDHLLFFDGFMLHASCIVINGDAYLFSGQCGIGKSTHTRLLKNLCGGEIINDDKPALRKVNGVWTAYGTPWCGKDHVNKNLSAPVRAIIFLTDDRSKNDLRPMETFSAAAHLVKNSLYRLSEQLMPKLLQSVDEASGAIPCYSLSSLADEETARLIGEKIISRKSL